MADPTPVSLVAATAAAIVGRTAAGSRVYPWRTSVIPVDQLPAIVVTAGDGNEERKTHNAHKYRPSTPINVALEMRAIGDATWPGEVDAAMLVLKRLLLPVLEAVEGVHHIARVSTSVGQQPAAECVRIVAVLTLTVEYDVEYLPLDEEGLIEVVHQTETNLPPLEAEYSLVPEPQREVTP